MGDHATAGAWPEPGRSNSASFSDWLREQSEPGWTAATDHRFTQELSGGTLDEAVFQRYLVNEYSFVKTSTTVAGYAIAYAPSVDAQARLVAAARALTTEQRDYFDKTFAALGVPPDQREPRAYDSAVLALRDMVLGAAAHGRYEETLATMLAAEWMYLTWSKRAAARLPSHPLYREWITIHTTPAFEGHVVWMRGELDTLASVLPRYRQRDTAYIFRRTLELEIGFHDAAYAGGAIR